MTMIPLIEAALVLANAFNKPSRKDPTYFTYKEHTFMTEGSQTYALCYNTATMRMVFIKCDIKPESIKFIDKHKQIPVERLPNYIPCKKEDPDIGKRYFNINYADENCHN